MDIMIYMTVFNIYSNNPGTGNFFFRIFLDFFFLFLSYSIFFREIILMVLL